MAKASKKGQAKSSQKRASNGQFSSKKENASKPASPKKIVLKNETETEPEITTEVLPHSQNKEASTPLRGVVNLAHEQPAEPEERKEEGWATATSRDGEGVTVTVIHKDYSPNTGKIYEEEKPESYQTAPQEADMKHALPPEEKLISEVVELPKGLLSKIKGVFPWPVWVVIAISVLAFVIGEITKHKDQRTIINGNTQAAKAIDSARVDTAYAGALLELVKAQKLKIDTLRSVNDSLTKEGGKADESASKVDYDADIKTRRSALELEELRRKLHTQGGSDPMLDDAIDGIYKQIKR